LIHDPDKLVERQFQYLLSKDGSEFFVQLRTCLRILREEPRVAALLQELREEAARLERARTGQDDREAEALVSLKQKLLARTPEIDDSSAPEPTDQDLPEIHGWFQTLAAFDAISEGRRKAWPEGDGTRSERLAEILGNKLQGLQFPGGREANVRPDLQDMSLELVNLREAHDYWVRESNDEVATSPGIALIALEAVVFDLNPKPVPFKDFHERVASGFSDVLSGKHNFRSAVYGMGKAEGLAKPLARCKGFAERVQQELRLKIGSRRSALALLRRFKVRCQIYDRARMQGMAADDVVNEKLLTAELALWLFDQGLNPLVEVPIGGLRPDLLEATRDPSASLYVEAKQYKETSGMDRRIQRWMNQVYTTVGRLRGDHLDVTEAFLVVFRRGGQFVHLPEEVPAGDYVVFPILIDLTAPAETGSQEKLRTIEMTAADLRPEVVRGAESQAGGES
jgi:hypothetical protein